MRVRGGKFKSRILWYVAEIAHFLTFKVVYSENLQTVTLSQTPYCTYNAEVSKISKQNKVAQKLPFISCHNQVVLFLSETLLKHICG